MSVSQGLFLSAFPAENPPAENDCLFEIAYILPMETPRRSSSFPRVFFPIRQLISPDGQLTELRRIQIVIESLLRHQLFMIALFDDAAVP
jgi:hypothetical protein